MRNIPIEFEITNDQLASMETTDIESFLYETIRENISTQLLTQLEDDGFIDISPTDASYKVTCNLVIGSQKEFYSAITDVAKELIARQYDEGVTNNILSPLYKLMGEEQEGDKDSLALEAIEQLEEEAHVTVIYNTEYVNAQANELVNRHMQSEAQERIKDLIRERENGNLLMLIDIANEQGYIEFNNIQAGCTDIIFRQLIKEALPAFYEQHKSTIEGTTND